MSEIKVVIVDDSPFSVGMINNILTERGFTVVGSANGLKEAMEVVAETKPDLVTMDMTMPGADGLECTEAIRKIDPNVKVIIISSMMDDEILHKAKKVKISGYIQKPIDADELELVIKRTMANEELFSELEDIYYKAFKEAFADTSNKFFKELCTFSNEEQLNGVKTSRGLSVVMGIIGKYGGRMIIDMSRDTANQITTNLLKIENPSSDHVVNVIAEISNIVAGNACSIINKTNSLYGLRVAPPTVVYGESIKISKAELNTVSSVVATTSFGEIYLNVGFSRSESYE